jgi:diguanylate cyclase (GGDEF)-like protein
MVTAVVAACAVLVSCGLALVWLQRVRTQSERRLDQVLHQLDGHLAAMSANVARAVDAVAASGSQRPALALTLDFDELVDQIVAETAARTGADAVVLRVEGPGGRPVVASFGSGVEAELLDRSFGPPGDRRFEAAAIDWTYSPAGEPEDVRFQSALVTPLAPTAGTPGVVAAYGLAGGAFRAEHAASLRELLRDAGVALANARRFAEVEARVNVDPTTGVRNRRGYELELGREVARAERSGRPLSVIVVEVDGREQAPANTGALAEVARLVTRVTRRSDISCRRGERELAILLPGTEESGATVLTRRLRDAAKQSIRSGVSTMAVGLVERLPAETSEELDLRIEMTFGPPGATVSTLDDARNASTAGASTVHSTLASGSDVVRPQATDVLRRDVLEAVTRELADARGFGRSLAIVALELEGLGDVSERHGREAADAVLIDVAGRLDRSVSAGSVHRLGTTTFALVLPSSGIEEAEALVDALQASLEPPHDDTGLVLSAGITELGEDDDPDAGLGRAEHALWQANQAGAGTIVVVVPNRRPLPPR